jgi:hypothetical protein
VLSALLSSSQCPPRQVLNLPVILGEQPIEIGDRPFQPFLESHARLPIESFAGARDIGAALPRIILGKRSADDL